MARRKWSAEHIAAMKARYPNENTADLAADLGHPLRSTYAMASQLGLTKSDEFHATAHSSRFARGRAPWNKGLKGISTGGQSIDMRFSVGCQAASWLPVGTERKRKGYLLRKVGDTGDKTIDWRPVHVLTWEEANGPVPKGKCVLFLDGDKANLKLGNLVLVSRSEIARLNKQGYSDLPPGVKKSAIALVRLEQAIADA